MPILLFLLLPVTLCASPKTVVICGIARDVAEALPNTMHEMERVGKQFADYRIIIYENNSTDGTTQILQQWAEENAKVIFIHEDWIDPPKARTESIAYARNQTLIEAERYRNFDLLLMADMDFTTAWPVDEIVRSADCEGWDCVSANGISDDGFYVDAYAFRDRSFPFGPEVIGDAWWKKRVPFAIEGKEWHPVYSAFGGLALYKMESIRGCRYNGLALPSLRDFYKEILKEADKCWQVDYYLDMRGIPANYDVNTISIVFAFNTNWERPWDYLKVTCCEHVNLHAEMRKKGCGRIFVNPKMVMQY